MINDKYLPLGSVIGRQYETIDILGEDDFEILYLVKDHKRIGSFFVLKELFLETFSSREGLNVTTIPEAQGVFDKQKNEIISTLQISKKNNSLNEIKTFGYIEENHTIYSIMEFSSNEDISSYLEFNSKSEKKLPSLEELTSSKKSFFSIIVLIFVLLAFFASAYYAYKIVQDDRKKINKESKVIKSKIIKEKTQAEDKEENETVITVVHEIILNIEENNETIIKREEPLVENNFREENLKEENSSRIEAIIEENLNQKKSPNEIFTDSTVNAFLTNFIYLSSKGSIEEILSSYDSSVARYFKYKDIDHKTIKKDLLKYNKKWTNREFSIIDFKILKTYEEHNIHYCEVETKTTWTVSAKYRKQTTGTSKGKMLLKNTSDGFKVVSIYTLK